jgi:hypothetical protein
MLLPAQLARDTIGAVHMCVAATWIMMTTNHEQPTDGLRTQDVRRRSFLRVINKFSTAR